jgi:hypothetical protein
MSEQVEWEIVWTAPDGLKRHSEGAQSRFGLTRAKKIQHELGEPWMVVHYHTLVPPAEHELWLKGAGKRWSP